MKNIFLEKTFGRLTLGFIADLNFGILAILIGTSMSSQLDGLNNQELFTTKLFLKTLCFLVALFSFNSGKSVWRWTMLDDIFEVIKTVCAYFVLYSTVALISSIKFNIPYISFEPLLSVIIMLTLMMGIRGFARVFAGGGDFRAIGALFRPVEKSAPPALLIGKTKDISNAIHDSRKNGPLKFRPLAIVSTDGEHLHRAFAGALVYDGRNINTQLMNICLSYSNKYENLRLVLVGERLDPSVLHAAMDTMRATGATISKISPKGDGALRSVEPNEVLGRSPLNLDKKAPRELFEDKVVLISGAGGTIGSELTKQIAGFSPKHLILMDISENNLYQINQEIGEDFPKIQISARLKDVCDKKAVEDIFENYRPQIVIHAAANKHVPMMESHPRECIRTNLGGTLVMANTAMKYGVESFVLISTDKAVNPSNLMGAAKRAAEIYIRHCNQKVGGKFIAVRFGNVLGSSGSVMPLFDRQISRGGPVTITNKEMTRWFMTVEESASLVLQGAALAAGGKNKKSKTSLNDASLLVLDMGEPIKIIEFAEAMIRFRGYEPYRDIQIIETGIRPGEKLHEELFYDFEEIDQTSIEGILLAKCKDALANDKILMIEQATIYAENYNANAALVLLSKIVPQLLRIGEIAAE